jgi:hypothetical protein
LVLIGASLIVARKPPLTIVSADISLLNIFISNVARD